MDDLKSMENKLQYSSLLENKHWKPFYFTGISSYTNPRNDGLSTLFDKFVSGGSKDALFTPFRGTFHKIQSPTSGLDPAKKDIVTGILMASFFMKGLVSTVTATVDAPLQRVKLLLQNQGELIKSGRLSRPYRGITDCFVRTIKKEGVISLWRGNSVNLIKIFPYLVLSVGLKTSLSGIVFKSRKERENTDKNQKLFLSKLAIDVAVLVCSHGCLYPLEYARTRLANDIKCGGQRKFKGLLDVYRRTLKSDGIVGIYRGISTASMGFIFGYCCFSLIKYGEMKTDPSKRQKRSSQPLNWAILSVYLVVNYPFETVCRRMMMTSGEAYKYKNSIDAFARIIRNEGIHSLYKGFGASIVCLIPGYFLLQWYRKMEKHNKRPFGGISVVIERK